MSILKQYLSNESFTDLEVQEVSMEELQEAELVLTDSMEELHTDSMEDLKADVAWEQMEEMLVAMEAHQEVLEFGLENQQFSPQYAAVLHSAMEQYNEVFGGEVASLESYGEEGLEQFYTVSNESIVDWLTRVGVAQNNIVRNVINSLTGGTRTANRRRIVEALNKKADATIAKIQEREDDRFTLDLKDFGKALGMGGKMPSNLVQAFKTDLKSTTVIMKDYMQAAIKYNSDLRTVLGQARVATKEEAESVLSKVLQIKVPSEVLSDGIVNGSELLNSTRVTRDEANGKETGEQLKMLRKVSPAKFVKVSSAESNGEVELTKAELIELMKIVKQYAAVLNEFNTNVTRVVSSIKDVSKDVARFSNGQNWTPQVWKDVKHTQWLAKVIKKSPKHLTSLVGGSISHLVAVTNTAFRVVSKAK